MSRNLIKKGENEIREDLEREYDPYERRATARAVAAEWIAMTSLKPDLKGFHQEWHNWMRIPKTMSELAEVLNVTRETISRWANHDEDFKRSVRRFRRSMSSDNLLSHIGEVDEVLIARARTGDAKVMGLFYREVREREGWTALTAEETKREGASAENLIEAIGVIAERLKGLRARPEEEGEVEIVE